MSGPLLVADVGNTQTVIGLYEGGRLVEHWRLSSRREHTADELTWQLAGLFAQRGFEPERAAGVMVASVVPHLDDVVAEAFARVVGRPPAFVGSPEVRTGIAVDYKNPREVGADRIVNALAARERVGSPCIVLDCGTATTFDVVSPEGHYAGGLILPGVEIALEALSQRAAKLPEVSIRRTDALIARDTVSSIQAGSFWGTVEALRGLIRRLRAEPGMNGAPVVATGGLSSLFVPELPEVDLHAPWLTLDGLYLLARRHFGGPARAKSG